jgi:hypothetical protein
MVAFYYCHKGNSWKWIWYAKHVGPLHGFVYQIIKKMRYIFYWDIMPLHWAVDTWWFNTTTLSQNVSNKLIIDAFLCPRRTANSVTLWRKPKNWCRKYVAFGYKQVGQCTQDTTPMVHLLLLLFRNTFQCRLNTVITTFFLILAEMIPLDCQLFLWLFFVSCSSYINGVIPRIIYLSHKLWNVHI